MLAADTPARAGIVTNGSFESPGFSHPPDYRYLSDGDTSITGWTVHNDGMGEPPYWALIGGGDPSFPYLGSDGLYSVYLNQGTSIETTISVVAGTTYTLSFWATADGTRPIGEYTPLAVDIAGASAAFTAPNGVQTFSFTAAATDPAALLRFSNTSPGGDYKIYVLDAVSVEVSGTAAVPEPASVLLLGVGAAGLAAARRRARRA